MTTFSHDSSVFAGHPGAAPLLLTPSVAGLRYGHDTTLHVLVRIQAPDASASSGGKAAPPQAIALVLDRSGSMDGAPLAEARRCADSELSSLRPTDTAAIVTFDDRVWTLWPAVPVGDGRSQRDAIAGIRSGGQTNLHGGWEAGARALAAVPGQGIKRVMLLSDGAANAGITDSAVIAAHCRAAAARGVTTTTCGLGRGFNEALMIAMGQAGGGNHHYGERAEDLMGPWPGDAPNSRPASACGSCAIWRPAATGWPLIAC